MFLRLWYWFSGQSKIDLSAGDNSISLSPAQISLSLNIPVLSNEILFSANNSSLTSLSIVTTTGVGIDVNNPATRTSRSVLMLVSEIHIAGPLTTTTTHHITEPEHVVLSVSSLEISISTTTLVDVARGSVSLSSPNVSRFSTCGIDVSSTNIVFTNPTITAKHEKIYYTSPAEIIINASGIGVSTTTLVDVARGSVSLSSPNVSRFSTCGIDVSSTNIVFTNPTITAKHEKIYYTSPAEIIINASGIELSGKTTITSVVSSIDAQANLVKASRNQTTENNTITASADNVSVRASILNQPMLAEDVDVIWYVCPDVSIFTTENADQKWHVSAISHTWILPFTK